jgi:hypothetical protein
MSILISRFLIEVQRNGGDAVQDLDTPRQQNELTAAKAIHRKGAL